MSRFLLVCLGGALGTGARYLVSAWTERAFGGSFPLATLAVNLVGSFLLAALTYLGAEAVAISTTTRVVLGVGVLGGFTTYSTFSFETTRFLQQEAWATAGIYLGLSVIGGLVACVLGWSCARWLFSGA